MLRLLSIPLLVLALFAVACGDDDDVDAGAPSGTDPDPTAAPVTDLTIEYTHVSEGVADTYRITCTDDTASVTGDEVGVDGQAACDALAEPAVRERLTQGAPTDRACTEVYGGDDTAVITGSIDGTAVDTTVDRTNGCGIDEWDGLLAAILPSPIGVTP